MTMCSKCDGVGSIQVDTVYVERLLPGATLEQMAAFEPDTFGLDETQANQARQTADAARVKFLAEIDARRAAIRDSWYPCSQCRPKAFYRWAGHHHDVDHDQSECAECADLLTGRGRKHSRKEHGARPAERADVDF